MILDDDTYITFENTEFNIKPVEFKEDIKLLSLFGITSILYIK